MDSDLSLSITDGFLGRWTRIRSVMLDKQFGNSNVSPLSCYLKRVKIIQRSVDIRKGKKELDDGNVSIFASLWKCKIFYNSQIKTMWLIGEKLDNIEMDIFTGSYQSQAVRFKNFDTILTGQETDAIQMSISTGRANRFLAVPNAI